MREGYFSWPDFHQWNFGNGAGRKGGQIRLEIVSVEADRYIEQEAGGNCRAHGRKMTRQKCDCACYGIDSELRSLCDFALGHGDAHTPGHRFADRSSIR